MAKVVVIGGTGHVGTYLVPRLVAAGHEVINVSRGERAPYTPHTAWEKVEMVTLDRVAEDKAGTFGEKIAALGGDIVIDKVCFTRESCAHLVEALRGRVSHFLHTGTVWTHGPLETVPATEDDPRAPISDYGRGKSEIQDYLLAEARRTGFPATIIRPGHIVGPGWKLINPLGNANPAVFSTIARGETLTLPNLGLETYHHGHADDVAQGFMLAMANWSAAVGEAFNTVSAAALTARGYAAAMYRWFGHEPKLEFQPFEDWIGTLGADDARVSRDHVNRSPCHSIDKARRRLGYAPRYTSLEAIQEAVGWLVKEGQVEG